MRNTISKIRFKTLNAGGISGQTKEGLKKRRELFNSLKQNDITIITETKFKTCDKDVYAREWKSGIYMSCTPEPRAQAGVAILYRHGLEVHHISEGTDKHGRLVWNLIELHSKKILIVGVYAPSQGDECTFFKNSIFSVLENEEYDHVVLGGDWNLGMDSELDYYGYTQADQVRPKSRKELHSQVNKFDLLDIYRELHPNGHEKTWRKWNKAKRVADKEARLDYFLVDTSLATYIQQVGATTPFNNSFDHRPVILTLDFSNVVRGPGYWKFNNSMLDDQEFLKKVDDQIARIVYEYQEPVRPEVPNTYDLREILYMTPAQRAAVPSSLNPHQFLEFLLFSIKGVARRYGKEKKVNLLSRREMAEEAVRRATTTHDELVNKIRSGQLGENEEELIKVKSEIMGFQKVIIDIDTHLSEGAYIRCGAKWKCESEAPTKIFLQQEKWRGQQRFIGILEVEGDNPDEVRVVTHQPEIEKQINTFYTELYRKRETSSSESDLKEFMGDVGYESFKNCANKNTPNYIYEQASQELSREEILFAIENGKHGVAPGISGFSREFYQKFAPNLIDFIMKYIDFSEQNGILSKQQRVGIITLLPKGTKDKRALKNWRPITLLSTLYKIISGAIGNRFKKILPYIIHQDQKGFVDGRQISDVTRLLFDTITDAYSERGKKGIIMSIDFEKAFDSVSFSFIERVIESAGFPEKLKQWVSILLNDFNSHVNHAGNLLPQINLGRGARQGDPIASILFVLSIEILLTSIRTNEQITPYKFSKNFNEAKIESILEAFADDVNLIMPRSERTLREVILTLEKFETLSGLRVNKDKTQVLRIGRDATSDPILCPDLGLKWVSKLKILGIFLSANPSEMEENLKDKIKEISDLLGKWTFRNMTVYGRIQIVKSLALSKVTHLIQVIPNPSQTLIFDLQRIINNFVWKGSQQKKIVVREEYAQLPHNKGGLSIPNLQCFWNSLKMSWLPKLFQSPDDTTWKIKIINFLKNSQSLTCKTRLSRPRCNSCRR